ncbi:MAG: YeeE/YedE family protein [Woeseia sp.]
MANFTPVSGFLGGVLIGFAAALLLLANGRIAGISGIVGGLVLPKSGETGWRVMFVIGLLAGPLALIAARGAPFPVEIMAPLPVMAVAGLLVGFGTRMGGGCTSGHGVCGIARLSPRSIAATLVFMFSAIVTVWLTRHVFGGLVG